MSSPALTSFRSATAPTAANVRSLAKVNRGSGSVPSSADPCGSVLATQHLQRSPEKFCQKALAIVGGSPLTHGSQLGGVSKGSAGYQSPGIRTRRSRGWLQLVHRRPARRKGGPTGTHLMYLADGPGNTPSRDFAAWSAAPAEPPSA